MPHHEFPVFSHETRAAGRKNAVGWKNHGGRTTVGSARTTVYSLRRPPAALVESTEAEPAENGKLRMPHPSCKASEVRSTLEPSVVEKVTSDCILASKVQKRFAASMVQGASPGDSPLGLHSRPLPPFPLWEQGSSQRGFLSGDYTVRPIQTRHLYTRHGQRGV